VPDKDTEELNGLLLKVLKKERGVRRGERGERKGKII